MSVNRFVVCVEAQRKKGCLPGEPIALKQRDIELATDIGAALQMPSTALSLELESCSLDDFILWSGSSWECFALVAAKDWPHPKHKLRAHRLGLLDEMRGDEEKLDKIRPAFSLTGVGRFEAGARGQRGAGFIYGRKDVIAHLDLKTSPLGETESYQMIYPRSDMTLPELVATYLRKYWEILGQ